MAQYDYDIGIIGGGAAGLTVAAGSAQLGVKTLLVEKEPVLGGDCLHFGCVPSKTLIRSAEVFHLMRTATRFGLPEIAPPAVDFARVAERIRQVIATIQKHDSEERFCGLGVKVLFGEPAFLDDKSIDLDGRRISAAKWVIATGSRASTPPVPGLADTPHITNRELFSLESLPRSMVVLGGGPIALEMAQAFCRLGTQVRVVQRSGQVLRNEDQDMAVQVVERLAREGVIFHLGTQVKAVRDLGNVREVRFVDKDGVERDIRGERLLLALGRVPNVEGLGLENAGITPGKRGIAVDSRMRTEQKHIFAAGDVTGAYQFTHAAGYEGGIVVANAVFRLPRKADYTFMPRCVYTSPELAVLGLNEKQAREQGLEFSLWEEEFQNNDRALAEGEGAGKIKLLLDKNDKPLGVQILGPRAGDLLGEWAAICGGKVKMSTLAGAVHPYPTLAEISKRVAGDVIGAKLFSDRVRKGLKLFFNYKGRACMPKGEGEAS